MSRALSIFSSDASIRRSGPNGNVTPSACLPFETNASSKLPPPRSPTTPSASGIAAKTPSVRVGWEHVLAILMAVYHGTHGGEYEHYRAMYQVIRAIGPATMAPDSLLHYLERYAPPAKEEAWKLT